jgi:hypothetical protein
MDKINTTKDMKNYITKFKKPFVNVVRINETENEYKFFENLNGKGKGLTKIDLLLTSTLNLIDSEYEKNEKAKSKLLKESIYNHIRYVNNHNENINTDSLVNNFFTITLKNNEEYDDKIRTKDEKYFLTKISMILKNEVSDLSSDEEKNTYIKKYVHLFGEFSKAFIHVSQLIKFLEYKKSGENTKEIFPNLNSIYRHKLLFILKGIKNSPNTLFILLFKFIFNFTKYDNKN